MGRVKGFSRPTIGRSTLSVAFLRGVKPSRRRSEVVRRVRRPPTQPAALISPRYGLATLPTRSCGPAIRLRAATSARLGM
jgi:hypothetical protein